MFVGFIVFLLIMCIPLVMYYIANKGMIKGPDKLKKLIIILAYILIITLLNVVGVTELNAITFIVRYWGLGLILLGFIKVWEGTAEGIVTSIFLFVFGLLGLGSLPIPNPETNPYLNMIVRRLLQYTLLAIPISFVLAIILRYRKRQK